MIALKVRVEDVSSGSSSSYTFHHSPVNIGRNALNGIARTESFVSYWHGVVRFDDTSIQYLDLGSTNGTVVDGGRLQKNEQVELREASDVRIGTLRFHFELAPAEEAPLRRSSTVFGLRASELRDAMAGTAIRTP